MSKRNFVTSFDLVNIETKLEQLKTEYLRKKNNDNRLAFKLATLTFECLYQLSLPVKNYSKKFETGNLFNVKNWDMISKTQYYHLSGKMLYIIPVLTKFIKRMLDNLDKTKDPIRYELINDLYKSLNGWCELNDKSNKENQPSTSTIKKQIYSYKK